MLIASVEDTVRNVTLNVDTNSCHQYRRVASAFRIHSFGFDAVFHNPRKEFSISLEGLPVDSKMRA